MSRCRSKFVPSMHPPPPLGHSLSRLNPLPHQLSMATKVLYVFGLEEIVPVKYTVNTLCIYL